MWQPRGSVKRCKQRHNDSLVNGTVSCTSKGCSACLGMHCQARVGRRNPVPDWLNTLFLGSLGSLDPVRVPWTGKVGVRTFPWPLCMWPRITTRPIRQPSFVPSNSHVSCSTRSTPWSSPTYVFAQLSFKQLVFLFFILAAHHRELTILAPLLLITTRQPV